MQMLCEIKRTIKVFACIIIAFILSIKEFFISISILKDAKRKRLESELLITVHSLEKGMGLRNIKKGYGKQKAIKAENLLNIYIDYGYDIKGFAFLESINILSTYIKLKESWNEDIGDIKKKFDLILQRVSEDICHKANKLEAGCKIYSHEELALNKVAEFKELVLSRHSIRDYKYEVVDREIVLKAIELANYSPSACNRQPIKVYCTKSIKEAEYVDDLISGTSGFKGLVPNFAIVTCDRAFFSGAEQYQWYINGGIYVSYLSLAFQALGIGNCIMQWYAFYKNEKKLKKYFSISKTEAIIAIVGYGYYPESIKCIAAQRKNVTDTLFFND